MDEQFTAVLRPHLPYLPNDRELAPGDGLRELGLNSMQAIEVLFALEDAYGAAIPDDKLNDHTFETAGNLWEVVEQSREKAGELR
ncbi:acyl carrier protein (plasmid) [Streptomyces sp. BHT-5-2]|uniref:phosphopantetheine-binding protein n=1 Tax=Streptomyces sp. BHT-5-2 TaxID=2866715 RepID=UPI001C8E5CA4|nr:phosphopantetheine-binding protein [Streptomyces sp. BHT-5-2]QZL04203.1 acyl carrier protein [Streptomyces sp. BHT-5-2]QZL08179.1 acyl carrier protein [Streptomyces sp. BHT-5-2]